MNLDTYKPPPEEVTKATAMMTDEERASSAERVRTRREKALETALTKVCEKYPAFSERIKSSLETPQIGEHHNEGPKMDSHLSLILANLESVKDGNFHDAIAKDENLKETMRRIVVVQEGENPNHDSVNPALVEYTFFHDISKPDCLTLKLEGEKKGVEITWEQWKEVERTGQPYRFEGKAIKSISYFHASEGAGGQHGNKAAELLKGSGIPPEILIAISKHEVAYQFSKINAATYEEHFVKPKFTVEQQDFILTASYIDTMASLLPDGKADLGNFVNLLHSKNNYLLIKEFVDKGVIFRENELISLKKQDKILTREDVEVIVPKQEKYNIAVLAEKLITLVAGGQITVDEREQILSIVSSNPKDLGKQFASRMRLIKPLLESARE
ncbi:MAG: hypothetical protein EXS50_03605 [Candidatus Taylorbacteria bacterium]|nr:hypothetical protein [Candidatus Taylorbacteria bacterium]